MKRQALLRLGLIFIALFLACSCGRQNEASEEVSRASFAASIPEPQKTTTAEISPAVGEVVFICKSAGAKKYHFDEDCHGLKRCKHEIEKTTRKAAEGMGLGLCGFED